MSVNMPFGPREATLSERELSVLRCVVDCWLAQDTPLYGNLSYQDAVDLLAKLGLPDVGKRLVWRLHVLQSQEEERGRRT